MKRWKLSGVFPIILRAGVEHGGKHGGSEVKRETRTDKGRVERDGRSEAKIHVDV